MKNTMSKEMINKIKNILLKQSEGYFYNEEILEYQNKTETLSEVKNQQLNFLNENNTDEKDKIKQNNSDLTLFKKKVTTHYVPPDLLAVKMLIEIFGKEISEDDLSSLSDKELINLKDDIVKKLEEL